MQNLFENTKIIKLILIYFGTALFLCVISEIPAIKSSNLLNLDMLVLLCNLGILMYLALICTRTHIDVKKEIYSLKLGLKRKDIIFSILINITFSLGTLLTILCIMLYVSPSLINDLLNEGNQTDTNTLYSTIVNAVSASIIAPTAEEFIFRGVILNRAKLKFGVKKAMIISSILFAMIHYNLGMISAFVFGILMCLIYLKTKNIFVTSAIHTINNLIVSIVQVVSFFASNGEVQQNTVMPNFNLWWLLLGIFALIAALYMSAYFIKDNLKEIRHLKDNNNFNC